MPHNIDSMAFYGDPPWHGLGNEVPANADARTMISAAGLDWKVKKSPLPGARLDEEGKATRFQLVRRPGRSGGEVQLGLVSARYEPLQNEEAFEFFNPLIAEKQACFETAGALGDGERVWVLAKLKKRIRIVADDVVDRYLLLSNSHSGKEAVTVKITPIRVVCRNTLFLALEDGRTALKVRHTRKMALRLEEVSEMMAQVNRVCDAAADLFQDLARVKMDDKKLKVYLDRVIPRTPAQKAKKTYPEPWQHIERLFEEHDDIPEIEGTLWAAYNAVARFEDYRPSTEAGPDRRLERTWFGKGADLKVHALKEAEKCRLAWN